MGIGVKVFLDSVSPDGIRLATLGLTLPREILAEFNTHRMLSRSAMSSRAIPIQQMLDAVRDNPYIPIHWGVLQKGMQADRQLTGDEAEAAKAAWLAARDSALEHAKVLKDLGLHKQVVNRVVEPYSWTKVVVSATSYSNFFGLRTHVKAHPAFRRLARYSWQALQRSVPKMLDYGQWHLPLLTRDEAQEAAKLRWTAKKDLWPIRLDDLPVDLEYFRRLSAARCARVSYNNHDGTPAVPAKDLGLWETLVGEVPRHSAPTEHQATPDADLAPSLKSNFSGWLQYRKLIPTENIVDFIPGQEDLTAWVADGDWLDELELAKSVEAS